MSIEVEFDASKLQTLKVFVLFYLPADVSHVEVHRLESHRQPVSIGNMAQDMSAKAVICWQQTMV